MMMKLVLTSNFPSTGNDHLFAWLRAVATRPRIAWIPPYTDHDRKRFTEAQTRFAAHGFDRLAYCDIDQEINRVQLAQLADYDVIYLSGGDPLRFRHNILRAGLSARLQECLAAGRLIIGASGGSMQLTQNVSLFRLVNMTVDEVLADHATFAALGLVTYELLPHLNMCEPPFLEQVRRYSERVEHQIIGIADGAALLHTSRDEYQAIGVAQRFHRGIVSSVEPIA